MKINAEPQEKFKAWEPSEDYADNIAETRKWAKEKEPFFPDGFKVIFSSLCHANDAICFIFTPPKSWHGTGFAEYLSLNQKRFHVINQRDALYRQFCKFSNKEYYDKIINQRIKQV